MAATAYDAHGLWQKDRDHALHAFTHIPTTEKEGCLIISRGEGPYVFDTDDKKYLDGVAALWCVNIGHGRDEMGDVMAAQAK